MSINAGETVETSFTIDRKILEQVDQDGKRVLPKGDYQIHIGNASPSSRTSELGLAQPLTLTITVE